MATSTRRLVALVVLPQEYNPGARAGRRNVEEEKFHETMKEIAAKFGGGVLWSFGRQPPQGFWWDRGVLYKDEVKSLSHRGYCHVSRQETNRSGDSVCGD